jgi:protein disulfide-isomerase A6
MKQTWEDLGTAFEASSSVVIGDVDCTIETDIASTYDVSGYPTIKYFTPETDKKGDSYSGGRDFDSLKKFVEDTLERKCDMSDPSTCSEKEQKFIAKMKGADQAAVAKELARLEGMKEKKMKAEQKTFLFQRLYILGQLTTKEEL